MADPALASRLFMGPALRTQPDRRLVTLVREGYGAAFEEIVRRYGRPLGRYAASIVGGRSEDVLQDAFTKALPALQRGDAEIDLRPWLFRIVRNAALNDLRDSPPTPELLAEALAGGRNPADELEQREELVDLMKRLQALPDPQRAAIVMRELEGLGHEEIAMALGLTDGGARQAIYRARQALRDGAGMLLPLPLVRLLIDHGGEAVGVGAGSGAGGALAAAGASAGGAGAAGALKLGVVAAAVAGSVGAGVAVQDHESGGAAEARPVPIVSSAPITHRSVADAGLSGVAWESARRGHGSGSGDDSRRDRSGSTHGIDEELGGHRVGAGGGPGPSADQPGSHEGRGHGDKRHGAGSGGGDGPGSGGGVDRSGSSRGGDDGVGSGDSGRRRGSDSGDSGGGELGATGDLGPGGPGPSGDSGHDGGGSGSDEAPEATSPTAPPRESSASGDSGSGSSGGSDGSGESADSGSGSSSQSGSGGSEAGGDGQAEPAP